MSRFRKRHPQPGSRPGTLVIPDDAAALRCHLIDFDKTDLHECDIDDLDDLQAFLAKPSTTWIDIQGLGNEQAMRRIGEIFHLHALTLEDVVNVPQRPKLESYDEHLLIVTRMVHFTSATHFETEQVSVVIGAGFVLTFQERHGDVFDSVRKRIRRGKGPIREFGADYLGYALLDSVIDAYYPVLEKTGDFLEELEDEVIQNPAPATLKKIYRAKRELLTLRRSIWPQREAINALLRDESDFVSKEVRVYLRDTYDHCVQIIDGTETYRELASGLMDVYLSSVGNRQNEVMKVLTVVASIFIPLTFLAGVYGMNFEHIPELHYRWSYPILLGLMVTTAAGMALYFHRLGWIGKSYIADDTDDIDDTEA